jgi:hypothetical protein
LVPATKNMLIASRLPAQAKAAISEVFREERSANAPTTGSTSAEMIVETVTR